MPSASDETLHDLTDFAGLLVALEREALSYAVIGGCAVGVYARLGGETTLSADLDLYVAPSTLALLFERAQPLGLNLVKGPVPRAIPVAVFDWSGLEVNVLTSSTGLPSPDSVIRSAREVRIDEHGGVDVPIADPFDLLANKLSVQREKDLPHIDILRRFVEEEVIYDFGANTTPRKRMSSANRLLAVLGSDVLPNDLALRLVPLADHPALRRFLASRAPTAMALDAVLERAASELERTELQRVAQRTSRT